MTTTDVTLSVTELRALKHVRCYGREGYRITSETGYPMAPVLWSLALAGLLEPTERGDWEGYVDTPLYGTVRLSAKGAEALGR